MTTFFSKNIVMFGFVGIINTAVDVCLFVLLVGSGVPLVLANIISTSVALSFSFKLNFKYVFGGREKITSRTIYTFLAVTLTGLWVLQPIVVYTALFTIEQLSFVHELLGLVVNRPQSFDSTLAKLASVPITMLWNFLWYRGVVFTPHSPQKAFHKP